MIFCIRSATETNRCPSPAFQHPPTRQRTSRSSLSQAYSQTPSRDRYFVMPVLANQENPNIIRHNLCISVETSDPDWPPDVVNLVHRLKANPLPSWLATDPQPLLSNNTEDLFVELIDEIRRSETRPSSALPSDRDLEQYHEISNILGHLLFIVGRLQYRADHAFKGFSLGPNTSFLASFVETCMLASCPDAIVLDGVWFALAKHPYATSDPLSRFLPRYAKATLIALSPFRAHPPEDPMEIDEEMRAATPSQGSSQNASNSTQSESDEDDAPQYPRRFTVSEFLENDLEENRAQSMASEVPSDAESVSEEPLGSDYSRHMMMDDWRGPDCLAALVMAKPGLVEDAISSALYQRRVWGVQSPVLGLAFDPEGTAIQVIIGWLGKDSAPNSDLPPVNLLHCSATHLAHGVFDLKRCSDALLLAFLLLSLSAQLASDKSFALGSSGAHLIDIDNKLDLWREDQVTPPEEACTPGHMLSWLRASLICSVRSLPGDVDCDMGPKTQRDTTAQGRQVVSEGDPPSNRNSPEVDISAKKSRATGDTILSMSTFASGKKENRTSSWLYDRFVFQDALTPTKVYYDDASFSRLLSSTVKPEQRILLEEQIPHLKLYLRTTSLLLPLKWVMNVEAYPDVPGELRPDLKRLADAVERRARPIPATTDEMNKVLSDKLSDLLRFSSQAAARKSTQNAQQANEAEHRKVFDGIIELILSDENASAPIKPILERSLHAAHDEVFDQIQKCIKTATAGAPTTTTEDATTAERVIRGLRNVRDTADFVYSKHLTLLESEVTEAAVADVRVAGSTATVNAKAARKFFKDTLANWLEDFSDEGVTPRWKESPRSGICDLIAVVQIPDFFKVGEEKKARKLGPIRAAIPRNVSGGLMPQKGGRIPTKLERVLDRWINLDTEPLDIMGGLNFDSYEANGPPPPTQQKAFPARTTMPLVYNRDQKPKPGDRLATLRSSSKDQSGSKATSSSEPSKASPPPSPEDLSIADETDPKEKEFLTMLLRCLLLPLLVCEYKKNKSGYDGQGPNQIRMYLTSMVKFLGILGIYNFHVYGLLTEGTVGGVICAWMTEPLKDTPSVTHILERNCRGYDIADPLGAINFAVFLLYLRFTHAPALRERFEAVKESVRVRLDTGDAGLNWTMEDQVEDPEYSKIALKRGKDGGKGKEKQREKEAKA
ncbi:hypothetical protein OF83DRAFT_1146859 [Amylostereum chailletii]|nr:hypothetical protein OF83DRAFT_1146859 [Amylostereum chailletii]